MVWGVHAYREPGIDPQLRGATSAGRDDQHGICGIDHQPGSQPPVREEAADGVDAAGSALAVTSADKGSQ